MEITQDKSYRLLLRSGRNYNLNIKATKNIGGVGGYSPQSQENVGSRAERRPALPQAVMLIHSMDSALALGP